MFTVIFANFFELRTYLFQNRNPTNSSGKVILEIEITMQRQGFALKSKYHLKNRSSVPTFRRYRSNQAESTKMYADLSCLDKLAHVHGGS